MGINEGEAWERALDQLGRNSGEPPLALDGFSIEYRLDLRDSRLRDRMVVAFYGREEAGDLAQPLELDERALAVWPDEDDRQLLGWLLGARAEARDNVRMEHGARYARSVVRPGMYDLLLPALCKTGRFYADLSVPGAHLVGPLVDDRADPFSLELYVEAAKPEGHQLCGRLVRTTQVLALDAPTVLLSSGVFLQDGRLHRIQDPEQAIWACRLRRTGPVHIPTAARDRFMVRLAQIPDLPELSLPPELHWSRVSVPPRPRLELQSEGGALSARLVFDYDGFVVEPEDKGAFVAKTEGRHLMRRDRKAESKAKARLSELGLQAKGDGWLLSRDRVAGLVKELGGEGWLVHADGGQVRQGGVLKGKVRSGIDWFDLEGSVDYDGATAPWPELLAAARDGRPFVSLSDGSKGLAPDWLHRVAALARVGDSTQLSLRFSASQAGILDALLTGHDAVDADVKFARLRKAWKQIDETRIEEPPGFRGKLRPYQKKGLAWLRWLEATGCGGCLADDMGLGKTVQVLSWLQGRHPEGRSDSPSLIVVPRSLVDNWAQEASKFTELRVLVHSGQDRKRNFERLDSFDLVVMTYGTLRTDILELIDFRFRTLVLDEAQAIKNPRSQAAKAVRLVRADQKLAVTGTPIENGLDELWSLFDFLNPGMLGDLDAFSAPGREKDDDWLDVLRSSLKPFMLRRTKEQVLTELPGKTEQTIRVPLGPEDRRRYDELRDHYRASLKTRIQSEGIGKAKIQVLEALLRLRQAACHPGLIDPSRRDESSAKLDVLMEKLVEVVRRGHKALVFSQFTELLRIVARALDREAIEHAYLDGGTANRGQVVKRFQEDPKCGVFLISIKAGGCGLNLTQSDYVFILDPWWNPAVEAQAVDRAHRMGQKNRVFAYRLIGEETVEEKIMALKSEKRKLADAIVSSEQRTLKDLDAADLEQLLG